MWLTATAGLGVPFLNAAPGPEDRAPGTQNASEPARG
jgi:hypothetical protein